jgi:hypothetical protein
VAKDKAITSTPSMYRADVDLLGRLLRIRVGGAWGTGTDIRTGTIVTVETLVAPQTEQAVVGRPNKTTNPSNVDSFVKELAAGAVREMKKVGLLWSAGLSRGPAHRRRSASSFMGRDGENAM